MDAPVNMSMVTVGVEMECVECCVESKENAIENNKNEKINVECDDDQCDGTCDAIASVNFDIDRQVYELNLCDLINFTLDKLYRASDKQARQIEQVASKDARYIEVVDKLKDLYIVATKFCSIDLAEITDWLAGSGVMTANKSFSNKFLAEVNSTELIMQINNYLYSLVRQQLIGCDERYKNPDNWDIESHGFVNSLAFMKKTDRLHVYMDIMICFIKHMIDHQRIIAPLYKSFGQAFSDAKVTVREIYSINNTVKAEKVPHYMTMMKAIGLVKNQIDQNPCDTM